ncbi:MAG: hypothetical protein JJE40_02115 [Vicinamibacteria bacterium]|nr:hypothetical protein [Vicinamibacteria bacterium]
MTGPQLRLYSDLAAWWPLMSPPSHYVEEAEDVLPRLLAAPDAPPRTILERGSGGGSLASLYVFALREADGTTHVERDLHRNGVFARAAWFGWLQQAGFSATSRIDPWRRDVFVARKSKGR